MTHTAILAQRVFTAVDWSSSGIITYANRSHLILWEPNSQVEIGVINSSADVRDAVWSPDGYRLATLNADRTLQIWDVNSDLSAPVTVMSLTAERFLSRDMQWLDNNLLAVNLWTDIQIWDTSTGVLKEVIETDHFIFGLGVLDNNELAFAGPEAVSTVSLADLQNPITCTTTIPATDVPALISAITAANSAGSPQTVCLEEGTYALTAVQHNADGPKGLPAISGDVTLLGLGSGAVIHRNSSAPKFRILRVTSSGRLVLATLKQALATGHTPTIFHSDQGTEFMAQRCTDYLAQRGVRISVSDLASPWQNGYIESFFGRFKQELGNLDRFATAGAMIEAVYQHIHYYNHRRIYTALRMPPATFAAQAVVDNHLHILGT